jgi:hypothetical protein
MGEIEFTRASNLRPRRRGCCHWSRHRTRDEDELDEELRTLRSGPMFS